MASIWWKYLPMQIRRSAKLWITAVTNTSRPKKQQEAKKKATTFQLKEIKVRPKTGEHDLQVKIGHIKKFLTKKDKVKVTVMFRGREITLSSLGRELLDRISEETAELAVIEQSPKFEGRTLVMVLAPK
jgi:translation initiation factor IF-3